MAYSPKVAEIFPELDEYGYHKLPITFAGDLNVNLKSNEGNEFIDYMQDRFGVQLNNDPSISIYIFILQRCFTVRKICFILFFCILVSLFFTLSFFLFSVTSRISFFRFYLLLQSVILVSKYSLEIGFIVFRWR
jgi:hypothetical protein